MCIRNWDYLPCETNTIFPEIQLPSKEIRATWKYFCQSNLSKLWVSQNILVVNAGLKGADPHIALPPWIQFTPKIETFIGDAMLRNFYECGNLLFWSIRHSFYSLLAHYSLIFSLKNCQNHWFPEVKIMLMSKQYTCNQNRVYWLSNCQMDVVKYGLIIIGISCCKYMYRISHR